MKKIKVHQERNSHGQGLVEFALILPLLLLLLFGLIEFGRIFQAWLTVEHVARQAARYVVSGQYNEDYCDDVAVLLKQADNNHPDYAAMDLADGVSDCRVPPGVTGVSDDDPREWMHYNNVTGRLQDAARLWSIRDEARGAAAGIAIDDVVSGDITRSNDFHWYQDLPDEVGDRTKRGWFHVTVCSTRRSFQKPIPEGQGMANVPDNFKRPGPFKYDRDNPQYGYGQYICINPNGAFDLSPGDPLGFDGRPQDDVSRSTRSAR